jgi:hypothetical protein
MSGWTIDTVPSMERASLHISRKCVAGTCHWQSSAVSSWKSPECARQATFCSASPNFQSAGEHRVGLAEHHERLHAAGFHVDHELPHGGVLLGRHGFGRRHVDDGLAGVAEHVVDGVREGVHGWRLRLAGEDERAAAMRAEILGDGIDVGVGARGRGARHPGDTQLGGDGAGEGLDLAGLHGHAVIGAPAGDGRRGFGHVETAHALGRRVEPAARRERAGVLHAEGVLGGEEVGVERDDDVGLREVVHRLHVFAERQFRAGARVVTRRRFPLHPARLGVLRQNLLDLGGQRRRVDRLGEDAETGAPGGDLRRERALHRGDEGAPRANLAELGDGVRAIGVVEREHRGLRVEVGGALAGGVVGVAFDLGRAPVVALHEQARRHAAERHRRGVEERLARHDLFGLPHVRHDELVGLHGAAGHAGERQRRAHQLEEAAPAHRVVPLGRIRRELAVQEFLELRGLRNGFEAAPVLRATGALELGANRVEI